ncbi:hypothetical protein AQ490_17380 [Wenjunlia vitaminophila]|uniref:Uncharacterized protein n=1 Tax=Wenjunlia vitaminophila TaxID=76728 RepID=A0A0T6LVY4_WENVI|nr:hypothetical protein AQ490_17380 [Wenjunlia vitaminophila]
MSSTPGTAGSHSSFRPTMAAATAPAVKVRKSTTVVLRRRARTRSRRVPPAYPGCGCLARTGTARSRTSTWPSGCAASAVAGSLAGGPAGLGSSGSEAASEWGAASSASGRSLGFRA